MLSPELIEVWHLRTEDPAIPSQPFENLLSTEELARAARFRFPHLKRNYVLSRASLRILCARYLNTGPAHLAIEYGVNGKPRLAPPGSGLHFNLSHSGGLTSYAFARDLDLGIDVEKTRSITEIEDIVHRFFCPEEAAEVLAVPEPQRTLAFHTCWTRKEAFIKATGNGLSTALDSFRVTTQPASPARLIHLDFDKAEARCWTMHDLNLAPPYVGALCYRGPQRILRVQNFEPALR